MEENDKEIDSPLPDKKISERNEVYVKRDASDNRVTLILLRDNYHAWAVDRAPSLLIKYQRAIDKLGNL